MALTIVKHSTARGIKMSINDLDIHQVKNPDMRVLARMGANGQLWPEILRHNGQEYHYVSNEVMTNLMAGRYSGYALYSIKNYAQGPITNKEFACFLISVGTAMRNSDVRLREAIEPATKQAEQDLLGYITGSLDIDAIRGKYILDKCWASMRGVAQPDLSSNQDDEEDDFADDENEEDTKDVFFNADSELEDDEEKPRKTS